MRRLTKHFRTLLPLLVLLAVAQAAVAQRYPERKVVRSGNAAYEKENYPEAETRYRKAQEIGPTYEALFNLADAMYKQKRYDEAAKLLQQISRDDVAGPNGAAAWYNLGNTYFQQKKLPEAAEAYKNALRRNPSDEDARYNLAYVLELMKQNDQNNQNNNDQNKNDQQNQDQNKDQNKNKQDNKDQKQPPKKDQGDGQKDQDKKDQGNPDQKQGENPADQKPEQGEGQPQEGRMSQDEAERMLEAVQGSEDNTKKKVDARKVRAVGRSGKNW